MKQSFHFNGKAPKITATVSSEDLMVGVKKAKDRRERPREKFTLLTDTVDATPKRKALYKALQYLIQADAETLKEIDVSPAERDYLLDGRYFLYESKFGVMSVEATFIDTEPESQYYNLNRIDINFSKALVKDNSEEAAEMNAAILIHENYHVVKEHRATAFHYPELRLAKHLLYSMTTPRLKGLRFAAGVAAPFIAEGLVNEVCRHVLKCPPVELPYLATAAVGILGMRAGTWRLRSEERKANRMATVLSPVSAPEATEWAIKRNQDKNLYEKINGYFCTSKNPVTMFVNNLAALAINFTHPLPVLRYFQNKQDMALRDRLIDRPSQPQPD
jgi:hypothetical protein